MTTKAYAPKEFDIFIGIDVDKNSFSFTAMDHYNMTKSKKIPSNSEQFYRYVKKTYSDKKVICAFEAGPTGFHLYDYLKEKGLACIVVSPASIPKASNERVKNNRLDSKKIAGHLKSVDLKAIRVPEGPYRELRNLVKIRENYAISRKASKQRIRALLLSANLDHLVKGIDSKWSRAYINRLKEIPCTHAQRNSLDMLLMDLEYARNQTLSIHRTLKAFCKNNKDIDTYIKYLQTIPGIGFIVSVTVLAKIGDPKHLKNVREIAAFVGLVPTEYSTGDTINKGSITQLGNKILRQLLIESSWICIRKNTQLKQFYHRVKGRHHPKFGAKKAITAVARKLTQIIHCVLVQERAYNS